MTLVIESLKYLSQQKQFFALTLRNTEKELKWYSSFFRSTEAFIYMGRMIPLILLYDLFQVQVDYAVCHVNTAGIF